jgi:long-chain fatty acid transport protein
MLPRNQPPASVGVVTLLTLATVPAHATGFDLPDQDAFVIARGMAFAATADNPSAVYYNPAGITQLPGHNVRGGVYGLYIQSTYESPAGGSYDNSEDLHAVPQLFYTYSPTQLPLSFGLGLFSPFGLSSSWPEDTGFRTLATEGKLTYYTINPVVAWKIRPNLSIAAGFTANFADVDLARGLVWPTQPYDEFRFEGDGWDMGYNVGVLWQPIEKISLGGTFRSTTRVGLEGQTRFFNQVEIPGMFPAFPVQHLDAEADFPFPWKMILGLSYRPTPKWNLEFNADLTGWDEVGTVVVRQATAFPPLLPQDIPLVLEWEPSWYYEFGATRYLAKGWSVSAGYIFNENSVPDANYSPLVADLDRHFVSVGAGYQSKRLRIDLAYQFGYGPQRTVSGSAPSATGQSADGDYDFLSHALAITGQWSF